MHKTKSKLIDGYEFISYPFHEYPEAEMIRRSREYYEILDKRRSVRDFSDRRIPREVIENIIRSASTAPSGAHKQPWTFCIVSDSDLKKEIRIAAEKEERESYNSRMSEEWLKDLRPLQTDWRKPFLEIAPYLIIVFKKSYEILPSGEKRNNYYVAESAGIACGILLTAIHNAGLVALTHTPSPMNFLSRILNRPDNERPYLLIPVGYAAPETYVPFLHRKPLGDIAQFYEATHG